MSQDGDHYAAYYADKLWNLIPAIYRFQDTDSFERSGPMRELVNRIGSQAAVLRRAADRLWEDQSIETCDDWVIPYIADLLDARLVNGLAAREQRLNVAKTIHYRRRKGTVAVLEELASDITGWNVCVVEFFRRLGRTRHGLDPQIGIADEGSLQDKSTLLQEERLIGALTGTACGGWADLRSPYGAEKTGTAFDEYFHAADVRRGVGKTGWYNIPRLGVFLWRLFSFPAGLGFDAAHSAKAGATPIKSGTCTGAFTYFSFDPTGRKIPLFAAATRALGDTWTSPSEWQLPTPMSPGLLKQGFDNLYAKVVSVTHNVIDFKSLALLDGNGHLIDSTGIARDADDFRKLASNVYFIDPEQGLLFCKGTPPKDLAVVYHYGFASSIGAGEYDRTPFAGQPAVEPAGNIPIHGGKDALLTHLATLAPTGTLTIEDSFTYDEIEDIAGIKNVLLRSMNTSRPLIRLPAASGDGRREWTLSGDGEAELTLEGLFISGGDVVLSGNFKQVTLTSCTFDPGSLDKTGSAYELSVDGRELAPSCLWIDGHVEKLVISRCVMGPVNERTKGMLDHLQIGDSIVQAIGTDPAVKMALGTLEMNRCTVLGRASVHSLKASDCLLDDTLTVVDDQIGCIRFSAWSTGSRLPRQYECVEIQPQASVFVSRKFGEPEYAQLGEDADKSIQHGAIDATISEGAENGSAMGAFSSEQYPIKMRALAMKFEEYMPMGLVPVFINVT
ncbi:MAG: hypothetical protein PHE55_17285 [Methylococcaceae bacterium]|nr:hypothetical protein [Methylococcaceae bacterium]